LIVGTPIVVIPSTSNELDDTDQAYALHYLDEGLVCSSRCNAETMRETSRLAGSKEVIPILDVSQSFESTEAKDFRDSVLELDFKSGRDKITERITEEWEQLIVNEIPKISSPTCVSKPKLDHLAFTPIESSKPLDEKTSRILERLEIPMKLKSKLASPVITSSPS
ncbi:hypothetical protein Tco_0615453, partial [Tanacetum coccineum]